MNCCSFLCSLFGISRFILSSFFLPLRFLSSFVLSISLIGIIMASCSSFRYYDLKKMIAFSSIIHLNLAFRSLMCMNACGIIASIISSISHSLSSSFLSMLAGVLINKVYTRYYESFFFLDQTMRTLLPFGMPTNLGFAMTLNFVGEMFALIGLFSIDSLWLISYWSSCFLSTSYWFIILNRKLPVQINPLILVPRFRLILTSTIEKCWDGSICSIVKRLHELGQDRSRQVVFYPLLIRRN